MSDTIETITLQPTTPFVPEKPIKNFITREKVNILWTGGFDSTFRMLQLSKMEVDIQPYYLGNKRKSEKYELNAISAITRDILNHPETKCFIHPQININVSEIEPDITVTEAYNRLNEFNLLGSQYDWLGRFAKMVPGIELSLEKGNSGKAYNCIQKYANLLKIKNKELIYYIIDKENSTEDIINVFGNYRLPYPIFDITKLEMAENYKEMGFEHTLGKTWFCHTPYKNEPCGVCNPCKSVIEEGLPFRMTPTGLNRYKFFLKYGSTRWFNLYFKAQRLIANSK